MANSDSLVQHPLRSRWRVPDRQRVSFATLGCKTNQFESVAMQQQLAGAGFQVVPFAAGADLVIVNTCTVTNATDAQSRNLIRRARRLNPECRIIVTGCYAQIAPETLAAQPGVCVVIGNQEKQRLLDYLQLPPDDQTIEVSDIRSGQTGFLSPLTSFAGRSRAFVQIQNGCDAFCSYCIVPYARGPSRSSRPAEVLAQVLSLLDAGYAEIVLTGIHIGGYGRDLDPPSSLEDLVELLLARTGVGRLRLGSIEPTELSDRLIGLMVRSPVICDHLHIPLQSGDNAVLGRMGRHYDRDMFRHRILAIRSSLPLAGIGLDVITGFPGETDQEFDNTCQLLEELPLTYLHVFPYSRRPGTPAAKLPNQVPGDTSRRRAEILRHLSARKHRYFAQQFIGSGLEVVVENPDRHGLLKGVTRNYLDVRFVAPKALPRQCVQIMIDGYVEDHLTGFLIQD